MTINKSNIASIINDMIMENKIDDARLLTFKYIISNNYEFKIQKNGIYCEIRKKHHLDIILFFDDGDLNLIDPVFLTLTWDRCKLKFLFLDFIISSYFQSKKHKKIPYELNFISAVRNIELCFHENRKIEKEISRSIGDLFYSKNNERDRNDESDVNLPFFLLNSLCSLYGTSKTNPFESKNKVGSLNYIFGNAILNIEYIMDGTLAQTAKENSVHWKYPRRSLPILEVDDDEYVIQELKWQHDMMLKFVFGLYEFSGGIDAPIWSQQ